jgi:TolB-like protein/Flp pilus assembly protein TadD
VPPKEQNGQAVRRQLERVLSSAGFARSERLSQFLRFVVERRLEGKDDELKEPLIAIEVFGRKPDYDPKQDSIVRTEAGRLRARLVEYYAGEGREDPLVIELPKGGYTPLFRQVGQASRPVSTGREAGPTAAIKATPWLVAIAALAIALAAIGWWWIQHKSAPVAIAVLPLENLSHDPANDYFADGLTDELIRNLSIIEGLAVRSRTSSFAFRGKPGDVRSVGKQLAADYILEGSVLRAGQQLRINVQLVRVRDDLPLWSARFDRELTDVLVIQDEISRGIVNNLRLNLGRGRRRYETSVEAYDLYLHARALRIQRRAAGYREGVDSYQAAIAKDPSFAPAYAGLAAAYAINSAQGFGIDHADELANMRAAAEKAIQLDPLLAEAHDALGMAYVRDGQWEQSEKSFRRAIELDPSNSVTYSHVAIWLLLALDRIEEALHDMRLAERADPLSPAVQENLAWVLISAGRFDEAAGHCQNLPADYPGKSEFLGRARLGQERTGEAIQILASARNPRYLGYAYGKAGRREEAEKLAAAVSPNAFSQALIFAGLGDKDRTLEALDRMAPLGAVRIGRALHSPEFALLRGDPRLKALRKKVGLPE